MPELLPCGYLVGDNMNIAISLKGSNIIDDYKSLCSAMYVRWYRGTARIRPPHSTAAAVNQCLLPARPTATNLQQRLCCCGPMLWQTDGRTSYYFIDPAPHTTWTVPKNDNNNNKLRICIAVWRTSLILTGALIRKQVRYKVFGKHCNSRWYDSENSKDSLTMFWCSFVFLNFI